jgi:hypothetical protein
MIWEPEFNYRDEQAQGDKGQGHGTNHKVKLVEAVQGVPIPIPTTARHRGVSTYEYDIAM